MKTIATFLIAFSAVSLAASASEPAITGELKQWHKVTHTVDGPQANETGTAPNPFLDYRMSVVFTHESGSPQYVLHWVRESESSAKPWVVANDEQNPHYTGVPPDPGYAGFDGTARPQSGSRPYTLLPTRGTTELDLGKSTASFQVRWFNPRIGGDLTNGDVREIKGPGKVSLGTPPAETTEDWIVIARRQNR